MRVIVCQHGARHRYAIARMLEQEGALEGLYTDSTIYSRLGRMARFARPIAHGRVRRLLHRVPRGIPREKVFSTDAIFWFELRQRLGRPTGGDGLAYERWCRVLSREMRHWGVRAADTIYNMYCENLEFTAYAKDQGLRVVSDVYINPTTPRIMAAECERFPAWAGLYNGNVGVEALRPSRIESMLRLSDVCLCPSQWVVDGLSTFAHFDSSKVEVVPYGCSIDYGDEKNHPVKGRVLFVGMDPFRKGLPYLGQAAHRLRARGRAYDFRIIGVEDEAVRRQRLCEDLNFLGKLTSDRMKAEYLAADVFVLPTLSEGFASACIEAMAAGVPVITTPCAGTTIVSDEDGIIIPERDEEALADAIDRCIQHRTFRDKLADRARISAQSFSEENWHQRLSQALRRCPEPVC